MKIPILKVKIISEVSYCDLERRVNAFIKNHDFERIDYTDVEGGNITAYILYRD